MKQKPSTDSRFIIYRIFYGNILAYVGQTAQPIARRLQKHFFAAVHIRKLDPREVTRIEVAHCISRADMNIYERYYIELFKPPLNALAKDSDELTVRLPDLVFEDVDIPLLDKWRQKISEKEEAERQAKKASSEKFLEHRRLRQMKNAGELSDDEYWAKSDAIEEADEVDDCFVW